MLIDPKIVSSKLLDSLLAVSGSVHGAVRISEGLYEIDHFNFDLCLGATYGKPPWEIYPEFSKNPYGVCDSPEQFLTKLGDELRNSPRKFVVSFTKIVKAEQT